MIRILVIGKNGQLATAIDNISRDQCSDWSRSIWSDAMSVSFAGRGEMDLSAPPEAVRDFAKHLPACDIIINAAAYTQVDRAEIEPELAHVVNCQSPAIIARIARERGVPFFQVSTDYVFDGTRDVPYLPDAPTKALNVYGQTKAQSEVDVLRACPDAMIIRTSSVFGTGNGNFIGTMERLFADGKQVRVVDDQIMRPTYADHLAGALLNMAQKTLSHGAAGIVHVTGSGDAISWKTLAEAILAEMTPLKTSGASVSGISSETYGAAAARPAYSVLDMTSFEDKFGLQMPDWHTGLKDRLAYQSRHGT